MAKPKRARSSNSKRVSRNRRDRCHVATPFESSIASFHLRLAAILVLSFSVTGLIAWGMWLSFRDPDKANALAIILSGPLAALLSQQINRYLPKQDGSHDHQNKRTSKAISQKS